MKQSVVEMLTLGIAECIGTAMLVFFGCMGCVDLGIPGLKPNHLTICLGFGLTVMLIVNIFGVVSGSHLNPAVTLAAYVYKLVNIPTAITYVIGQFIGAFLGYGLLRLVTPAGPSMNDSFCVTLPNVDVWRAFGVEFFITMGLILICCGVWDPRNANHHDSVPLRFGLAISMLALVGGPYSGGSMNPARSFAPALYNMNFKDHWIYWVAPLLSAFVTSVTFRMVFYREATKEVIKPEEVPLRDNKNNV